MATADVIAPSAADFNTLTFELEDVHDDQLDSAIWLEANPALALALLSDEEVEGLAEVAQKNAEIAGFRYPIDRSFDIATYMGFTVGIRFLGGIDPVKLIINVQTFISLKTLHRKLQVKGPKLQGNVVVGVHAGPVTIGLPHVGPLDIWAKLEGKILPITIKVLFFGRPFWKRVSLPLPI